ncbi:Hypothetical protein, partial CDS, partial [Neorhizobium galegae bv. officinalis]
MHSNTNTAMEGFAGSNALVAAITSLLS